MDEQRILDEMERMLAADDPRLAARLAAFGQPGLGHALRTRRARATLSVMVLVLVAAVAAVIYLMSSFRPGNIPTGHGGQGQHSATPSKRAVTRPADGRATGAPAGRSGRPGPVTTPWRPISAAMAGRAGQPRRPRTRCCT